MARIRSRDTAPEIKVRKLAHALGYRFRLHRKDMPGKPDLVFPRRKGVIFVHGCFWRQHPEPRCNDGRRQKSRPEYWDPKLDGNLVRDARHQEELSSAGWADLVTWECETRHFDTFADTFVRFLAPRTFRAAASCHPPQQRFSLAQDSRYGWMRNRGSITGPIETASIRADVEARRRRLER